MKKLIRLLTAVSVLFLSAGCIMEMDPFEGGDGIRANINGKKCVMLGTPGTKNANYYVGGEKATFTASAELMHMLDTQQLYISFNISDTGSLMTDKKYTVGTGDNTVKLDFGPYGITENAVPLSGWISFLQISTGGSVIEARFELDGQATDGTRYAVRHGFLRLYNKDVN